MPDSDERRLAELRHQWQLWAGVRTDRCVDYDALPITEDELAAADGSALVAAYQVRDQRLAAIEAEAQEITALHLLRAELGAEVVEIQPTTERTTAP